MFVFVVGVNFCIFAFFPAALCSPLSAKFTVSTGVSWSLSFRLSVGGSVISILINGCFCYLSQTLPSDKEEREAGTKSEIERKRRDDITTSVVLEVPRVYFVSV